MVYRNEKSRLLRNKNYDFEQRIEKRLKKTSLKDVPLEERRKEANKPLYLTRYE